MPTATYKPLATVTLGSSAATVTFSNIPATYRDLIFIFQGTSTGTVGDIIFRLNGDGGGNYSRVQTNNAGSGSNTGLNGFYPLYFGTGGGNFILNLMDYSATDKHKTALSRGNNPSLGFVTMMASRWANTAVVTTIALSIDSGASFASGSTFNLYAVIA